MVYCWPVLYYRRPPTSRAFLYGGELGKIVDNAVGNTKKRASKRKKNIVTAVATTGLAIPPSEWSKPACYAFDNSRMATLQELISPNVPTKNLVELSDDQLAELVVSRLEMEAPDFQLAMMGVGIIDKARAIAEVKARSTIGRYLIEIEHILIDQLETVGRRKQ